MTKMLLNLVGLSHRPDNVQRFARFLSDGQPLLLVREPGNQHDPNAIQVYVHIGYVRAKGQASTLAPQMDSGLMKTPVLDAEVLEARGTYITLEVDDTQLSSGERAPEPVPEPEKPQTTQRPPQRDVGDDEIPF